LLNPVTKLLVDLGYDRVTTRAFRRRCRSFRSTRSPSTRSPSAAGSQALLQGVQDALGGEADSQGAQAFSRLASVSAQDEQQQAGANETSGLTDSAGNQR
jgi:hypothetical protein